MIGSRARQRGVRLVLMTAAVLAGSSAVAFATAQVIGAGGVIQGCYRTSEDDRKGELRVVSDPTACRTNELPISWSIQGPKGDTGATGANGAPGVQGPQGPPGPAHVITRLGPAVDVPGSGPINRLASVQCVPGETAVGGGSRVFAPGVDRTGEYFTFTVTSLPLNAMDAFADQGDTPTGWFVAVTNTSAVASPPNGVPAEVRAYVLCAS